MAFESWMQIALGPFGALVVVLVVLGAMGKGYLTRGSETDMWRTKYEELHEKYMGELEKRAEAAEAVERATRGPRG